MSSMLDVGDVKPPTYDDTVNESRVQLSCGETPTLFLDRTTIFANTDPPRALYELSNNVCEAKSIIYALQKVAYRVTSSAGGDKIRTRLDHIYDISLDPLTGFDMAKLHDVVVIEGKMSSKRTYKQNHLVPGVSSWKVKDHFKAGESAVQQLKHANEIHWKNMQGDIIAVETVAKRDEKKNLTGLPQLEIKVAMEDKEMDLLVASWMARLWRQSASETKEPMTWSDVKQIGKIALNSNRWNLW
ncbi:uncharacterized protein CTRU02_202617 [Colletotrichum truncatum]|uniref:Uncharacterized protein n=1 Tax=Colletotrichum truncatum TaxID=5467 RepID=A0ACC3ZKZ9_COLTU|nr:uncharacterized protein CTRU02_01786 [Colletotrichum truncatum]KAF6800107.1 hypothetical protein CTRU02_01786 [Colletotrichum truncatum]